jgi:3-dehydroquinate synthase
VENSGQVYCLQVQPDTILKRLATDENQRPLLADDAVTRLQALLAERETHYRSFQHQVKADGQSLAETIREIQLQSGLFRVKGMGEPYQVWVRSQSLVEIGDILSDYKGISGRCILISDDNVARYYLFPVYTSLIRAGFTVHTYVLPPGESTKNMNTVQQIWMEMARFEIDRSSFLIALGGGVVSDIGGFVAATYMRGIPWMIIPTSLLAMADASLGGKTGVDLPVGKNLVGAFHSPFLVWVDPVTLETLGNDEFKAGLAEVVKSGIIGDPILYRLCAQGMDTVKESLRECVCRSMGVKIHVIQEDPYEKGRRAVLNLGHTVAHAVELLSHFSVPHGFAVAMGMVAEARLAQKLGITDDDFVAGLEDTLQTLGLPTQLPRSIQPEAILEAMRTDKKKRGDEIRFALPVQVGRVQEGIRIGDKDLILSVLSDCLEK